ncbi:MAG: hypothetical protein JKY13_00645, partial [Gammaproteobacteria bacterium]|nr:hypothetical protein [Gammaproteobacteria bacterium]
MVKQRPIIFGEILFDCLQNKEVLGGAPLNVAWHLHGFDLNPLLISRIGDDQRGQQALQKIHTWGMDTQGIQIDTSHATSIAECHLNNGQASYDIKSDQAFDFIEGEQTLKAIKEEPSLIYQGSLATRQHISHQTLIALQKKHPSPLFIDINLRSPWWHKSHIDTLLQQATWAKMSDEEILMLSNSASMSTEILQQQAQKFYQYYSLKKLFVTLGEQGAFVVTEQGVSDIVKYPGHYLRIIQIVPHVLNQSFRVFEPEIMTGDEINHGI